MTLKERFDNYRKKKSPFSIASDIIFILLLIALLFPSSRMAVVSTIKRITLFAPSAISPENREALSETVYLWPFENQNGERATLSAMEGEVVFLNFWATWCPPCVAEMPSMQKLYDAYGEKVTFVLMTNEKRKVVDAFMDKKSYDMPIYYNRTPVPEELRTGSIPTTYIISKEGEIVLEKKGAAKWHSSKVKNMLDDLIQQ